MLSSEVPVGQCFSRPKVGSPIMRRVDSRFWNMCEIKRNYAGSLNDPGEFIIRVQRYFVACINQYGQMCHIGAHDECETS